MTALARAAHDSATPYIAEKLATLDKQLAAASLRFEDEAQGAHDEAIHDLRVAIRRIRTMLKLARRTHGRRLADAVRDAFTCVHRATGELRDEEVLDETLAEVARAGARSARDTSIDAWLARRRARERRLRRMVRARLAEGDLRRARAMLEGMLLFPVKPSRDEELYAFARDAVEHARRKVEKWRDVDTADVEGLHALRIAYKELRYTTELFAEVLPIDLAALREPAARLQKHLGEIHDVDMALATVARSRLPPTSRNKLTRALRALRSRRVTTKGRTNSGKSRPS